MSAIFEMPITSETLDQDELTRITGYANKSGQNEWLSRNGWQFHKNRSDEPIVGRMYARLKMAGITPAALTTSGGWIPDFSPIQ